MADESGVGKKIEDLFDRIKRVAIEQERASTNLLRSMEDLSKRGIDRLTEDLKAAAKSAGLLSDEQHSLIKNSNDMIDVIEHHEKLLEEVNKIQKKYKDSIAEHLAIQKKSFYQSTNGLKIIEEQHTADLKTLNLTKEEAAGLENRIKTFKKEANSANVRAQKNKLFDKGIEALGLKFAELTSDIYLISKSAELLAKGLTQGYNEFVALTKVGLQGALIQMNYSAMRLKMTFEEFSDVVAKNTVNINALGGGLDGIQKFTDLISESSKNLSFMGKDAQAATARFATTLTILGSSTKDSKEWKKTMGKLQDAFKDNLAVFHDSPDVYANLIDSQLNQETVTQRLVGLGKNQINTILQETVERTKNLKAIGMSNDQLIEFNKSLQDMLNPETINPQDMMKQLLQVQTAAYGAARENKGTAEGKELEKKLPAIQHAIDLLNSKGGTAELNKFMTSKDFLGLSQSLAKNMDTIFTTKSAYATKLYQDAAKTGVYKKMEILGETAEKTSMAGGNLSEGNKYQKVLDKNKQVSDSNTSFSETIKASRNLFERLNTVLSSTLGLIGGGALMALIGGIVSYFLKPMKLLGKAIGFVTRFIPGMSAAAPEAAAVIPEAAASGAGLVAGSATLGTAALGIGAAGLVGYGIGTGLYKGYKATEEWLHPHKEQNLANMSFNASTGEFEPSNASVTTPSPVMPTPPAPTATIVPTTTSQAPTIADQNLNELKTQTGLLGIIAQNTGVSYKAPSHKKQTPQHVAKHL